MARAFLPPSLPPMSSILDTILSSPCCHYRVPTLERGRVKREKKERKRRKDKTIRSPRHDIELLWDTLLLLLARSPFTIPSLVLVEFGAQHVERDPERKERGGVATIARVAIFHPRITYFCKTVLSRSRSTRSRRTCVRRNLSRVIHSLPRLTLCTRSMNFLDNLK